MGTDRAGGNGCRRIIFTFYRNVCHRDLADMGQRVRHGALEELLGRAAERFGPGQPRIERLQRRERTRRARLPAQRVGVDQSNSTRGAACCEPTEPAAMAAAA